MFEELAVSWRRTKRRRGMGRKKRGEKRCYRRQDEGTRILFKAEHFTAARFSGGNGGSPGHPRGINSGLKPGRDHPRRYRVARPEVLVSTYHSFNYGIFNEQCIYNQMLEFFSDITTLLARQAFQSGIISFDSHFPCLKQCVPKAPYHSPARCRIVRRLDGELIRARGSPNHRGTGFIAYSSSAKRQKHVSVKLARRFTNFKKKLRVLIALFIVL
ncbi:uncharacterized protein LOC115239022 [Formica exsecta]|uniref:uncharacterized protein LOC115239022 n=1 Tax=Formica exsecta TaxID=72781 RepID=UPI0011419C80|nr:uncharacterized protein LOC115239022 [Formica exsecta]